MVCDRIVRKRCSGEAAVLADRGSSRVGRDDEGSQQSSLTAGSHCIEQVGGLGAGKSLEQAAAERRNFDHSLLKDAGQQKKAFLMIPKPTKAARTEAISRLGRRTGRYCCLLETARRK